MGFRETVSENNLMFVDKRAVPTSNEKRVFTLYYSGKSPSGASSTEYELTAAAIYLDFAGGPATLVTGESFWGYKI